MEKHKFQKKGCSAEESYRQPEKLDENCTSLGMNENIEGLLCYVFSMITGLIFMLAERNSKFVKFHAIQSLLLGITVLLICLILDKFLQLLFWCFSPVISLITLLIELGYVIVSVFLAVKAYQMNWLELPIIGNIARNVANREGKS